MGLVKGRARGNGLQLSTYLQTKADNDNIRLLEIRGTSHPHDLRKSLLEMSLTSELTKSDKGLYHGLYCPDYGEDQTLSDEDWIRAADIMEEERGYTGQKRAIVLHDKKGKIHAHIVWERYDHETGIMKSDSFSYYAQDRARRRIEIEFGHQVTPVRNTNRPVMKEYLTGVWQQTDNADAFMQAIAEKGYIVAAGMKRPYIVVDETGRSFDLVRQLEGVRTLEVKKRFMTTKLIREKEAIEAVRAKPPRSKAATNDNEKEAASTHAKTSEKVFTMQGSFRMDGQAAEQSQEQLKKIVTAMDEKEAKKKAIQEKIMKDRLERAKRFRENERDM